MTSLSPKIQASSSQSPSNAGPKLRVGGEGVPSEVPELLVRFGEPEGVFDAVPNLTIAHIGSLFSFPAVIGFSVNPETYAITWVIPSTVSDTTYFANAKARVRASQWLKDHRGRMGCPHSNGLLYGNSTSQHGSDGRFHVRSFENPSQQARFAPVVKYLLEHERWGLNRVTAKSKVSKRNGRDIVVPSEAVEMMKEMIIDFVSHHRKDGSTFMQDIIARFGLKLRSFQEVIGFYQKETAAISIEIRTFLRHVVAFKIQKKLNNMDIADYIHSGAATSACFGMGRSLQPYDFLLDSGNEYKLAKEIHGEFKITESDDIALPGDDFGDNGISNTPRRGLGLPKVIVWPKRQEDIDDLMEDPPVEGLVALHCNAAMGHLHLRVYDADERIPIWTYPGAPIKEMSSLMIDIAIGPISQFWSLWIVFRSPGDKKLAITGLDTRMPRPYGKVMSQVEDKVFAKYLYVVYFTLMYNLTMPSDLLTLWNSYVAGRGDVKFEMVWQFFTSREAEIMALSSYQYMSSMFDVVCEHNLLPISPKLHDYIQTMPDKSLFTDYAVVTKDVSPSLVVTETGHEMWRIVDISTSDMDEVDLASTAASLMMRPETMYLMKIDPEQILLFKRPYLDKFQLVAFPLFTDDEKTDNCYELMSHALDLEIPLIWEHPFIRFHGELKPTIVLTVDSWSKYVKSQ